MNSILFYWVLWGIWVFVAFIMGKSRLRSLLLFGVLAFIIISGLSINVLGFNINLAWIVLLLWAYSLYRRLSILSCLTLMLSNLSITLCYVLIRIYWMMDPAIFLIMEKWAFTVVLTGLIMIIVKPFWFRLSTAVIGICQGDLLQSILFYPYEMTIGKEDCFNSLAVSIIVILGFSSIQYLALRIQESLSKQVNQRL